MSSRQSKVIFVTDKKPLSIAGLFAGVGGIETGFAQAGFVPVVANEIDEYAAETYRENYDHVLIPGDIAGVKSEDLPKDLTVLAGGFPCQPFSVAGYRKGFEDDRGNVFWEIERLYKKRKPPVIFLENVKNLKGHDHGRTFKTIEKSLKDSGYKVVSEVLNAKDFGNIPQNRERIYIVAFKSKKAAKAFVWPEKVDLTASLDKFIDFKNPVADKYYYEGSHIYNELKKKVTRSDTVYQWRRMYVRENMSGVCPTLTANMGMGGHNVPIIRTLDGRIRKLTPRECFNLMGFVDMKFPAGMAESRLYKQAGNAVVVPVIRRIAEQIKIALET